MQARLLDVSHDIARQRPKAVAVTLIAIEGGTAAGVEVVQSPVAPTTAIVLTPPQLEARYVSRVIQYFPADWEAAVVAPGGGVGTRERRLGV